MAALARTPAESRFRREAATAVVAPRRVLAWLGAIDAPDWLPQLVGVAVVELLLNRLFSRVGVFIPKGAVFFRVYQVLTDVGRLSFNASLLLALALVPALVWALAQPARGEADARDLGARAAAVAVAFAAAFTAVLWWLPRAQHLVLAYDLALAFAVAGSAAAIAARWASWAGRAAIGLTAGVHLVALAANGLQTLAAAATDASVPLLPWGTVASTWVPALVRAAEALALLAPFAWMAALRLERRAACFPTHLPAIAAGALAAAAYAVAFSKNADMLGVLAIWTLGFPFHLSPAWYGAALAVAVVFALAASRSGEGWRRRGAGASLIFLAGFNPSANHLNFLLLLGYLVLLLAGKPHPERRRVDAEG